MDHGKTAKKCNAFPLNIYVEMFVLHQIHINFMYVNLPFGKFASILCHVTFLHVVNIHH